ncbi:MAG: hypothetical protein PWR01_2693 [Clostridiales bacterium]|jgi:hypothetical protein|nr:hypothetical protein [Clostridiales bacterium]MDN5281620.1 hypothetical protein [Candidatus Ozemobacter sp.]
MCSKAPYRNDRRGVAIVIALFFSFCMLILFVSMIYQRSSTSGHNKLAIQERQAFFASRAAIQHFLLKAKLFPTELYDAVEFSQGKNPLCNFTEFEGTYKGSSAFEPMSSNPDVYVRVYPQKELDLYKKPKYFYYPLPGKDAFIRLASYHNPDYRFLAPGLAESDPETRYIKPSKPSPELKPDKFLKYYFRDCTNMMIDGSRIQPALEMVIDKKIKKITDWDVATNDGYPYTMNYIVNDVAIQSIKGLRKYGEEAIEIAVEGQIKDFQGKITNQVQKRTEKITRRGAL